MEENNKGLEICNRVKEILEDLSTKRKEDELINLSVNWASLRVVEIFERRELYPSKENEISYNVVIDEVSPSEDKFSYLVASNYFKKYNEYITVTTEW